MVRYMQDTIWTKVVIPWLRPLLIYFFLLSSLSAKWVTLEDCRLVTSSKNDGDSFVVKHDGEIYTFRLYFVDTPETGLFYPERVADQAKYFDSDVNDMLRYGKKSEDFARRFLSGRFTVHTEWRDAMGHSQRFAAVIYNQRNESLVEGLVENGLVRLKGFTPGSAWPGGEDVDQYRRLLEKLERQAKRDQAGAWKRFRGEVADDPVAPPGGAPADEGNQPADESPGLIDLNLASPAELISLPGIGPTYAERIVERRPFLNVDELVEIRGIGAKTLQKLKSLVRVSLPERFNETARYYLQAPSQWANGEVTLKVAGLRPLKVESPDGFVAFTAETGSSETEGGALRLYLPEDRVADALSYFERSSEPARLSVYFFEYQNEWVSVLRAN